MNNPKKCRICFEDALYQNERGFFCRPHAPAGSTFIGPTTMETTADDPEAIEQVRTFEVEDGPSLELHTNLTFLQSREERAAAHRGEFRKRVDDLMPTAMHAIIVTMDDHGNMKVAFMTPGDKLTILGALELAKNAVVRSPVS